MRRLVRSLLVTAALAAWLAPTGAFADPDELMSCKRLLVKAPPAGPFGNGLTKFVCKPPPGGSFALPSAAAAPHHAVLAVNVVPPGTTSGPVIPCTGLGNPAGSKGYKCKDLGAPVLLIKENVVKAIARYDAPSITYGTTHPYPGTSDVAIRVVAVGIGDQKHYCGRFGGPPPLKNDATQYRRRDAPAPTACSASGAFVDEEVASSY